MSHNRWTTTIVLFFVVDIALGLAFLLDSMIDHGVYKLTLMVNLELESNLPTWYSSIQLFLLSAGLGLFAAANVKRSDRKSWLLIAPPLLFLALSLDEVAEIHEWVGAQSDRFLPGQSRENTPFGYTGIWMFIVGVPFLALLVGLFLTLRRYFRGARGVLAKFILGAVVFLGGAAGVETVANFTVPGSTGRVIQVFFEEIMEMLGVTIMLWGTLQLLERYELTLHMLSVRSTKSDEGDG